MKNTLLATMILIMAASGAAFGQQKLAFNDNNGVGNSGTYGPNDTFTLDVTLKYRGFDSFGLSFWLEVPNALAPGISVTNVTYFTFLSPNQTGPNPAFFNTPIGAHPGYMTETRDLGATSDDFSTPLPPGSYLVASIQLTLSGAAPGTYALKSTTASPHNSEVTDSNFNALFLPAANYKITIAGTDSLAVVPEPTTLSLLGPATTGFGFATYRRRRRASKV